jgi:FkbM family methyltransferase
MKMQESVQSVLKMVIRFGLHLWPSHVGIPILSGPLKGKLLPKETARQNLKMWLGQYESIPALELLSTPGIVKIAYDIGAHVGYMALVLSQSLSEGGVVFAFEPIPVNQSLVEKLILLNGLQGKVRLVPLALGNTNGEQRMVVGKSSLMSQLEIAAVEKNIAGRPRINTAIATLDTFVLDQSNPPPDMIKIDVEGAEAMVIAGGMRTLEWYSPKILIEIHGPGNAGRTYELLEGLNYQWWHLGRAGSEKMLDKKHLLSFISKYSWTHHFMVSREKGS